MPCEMLDIRNDVFTLVADLHSGGLVNMIIIGAVHICVFVYRLNCDLLFAHFVPADQYKIAASFLDLLRNCVLIELIHKTLRAQDGCH